MTEAICARCGGEGTIEFGFWPCPDCGNPDGVSLAYDDCDDESRDAQDQARCPICDWPFAERREDGCVPGDCSYRPSEGSPEWHRIQQRKAARSAEERDALLQECRQTLTSAMHTLRGYQGGNRAPDLAEATANACEATLAKLPKEN